MLKFNSENKSFEKLGTARLKVENSQESFGLRETVVDNWELFRNEIGLPSALLIGDQVIPHASVKNSIDLLAFDPDDDSLVIIALDSGRQKFLSLQALNNAAMVNAWDAQVLESNIRAGCSSDPQALIDVVQASDLDNKVKVILISQVYEPEVIIAADWFSEGYSVDISAYEIDLHTARDDTFLTIDKRYPLKGMADIYESSVQLNQSKSETKPEKKSETKPETKPETTLTKKPETKPHVILAKNSETNDVTWEQVLPELDYSFAEKGIQLCSKVRAGDPSRRHFLNIRTDYDGFNWITVNFKRKYIKVYLKGDFGGAVDLLKLHFSDPIEISDWREGYTFLVRTESQFDDLVQWLELDVSLNKSFNGAGSMPQ